MAEINVAAAGARPGVRRAKKTVYEGRPYTYGRPGFFADYFFCVYYYNE